jgi:hypothetical protein
MEENKTESARERAVLGAEVAKILADVGRVEKLSGANLKELQRAIARVNMPVESKDAGIEIEVFDEAQARKDAGLLQVFLKSNIKQVNKTFGYAGKQTLTEDRPIMGTNGKPITFEKALKRMKKNNEYLRLKSREMLTEDIALRFARTGRENFGADSDIHAKLVAGPVIEEKKEEKKEGLKERDPKKLLFYINKDMRKFLEDRFKATTDEKIIELLAGGDEFDLLELYKENGIKPPSSLNKRIRFLTEIVPILKPKGT